MVLVCRFGFRENRLTSVCVSSAIPGGWLLSFACPKESNQRKRHPRGRGHAGIHARVTARAGSGVRREHIPVLSSNARASCACPRAEHEAISCACSPRPRGTPGRAERGSPCRRSTGYIRHRIYPTRRFFRFALRVPSEQRRRADGKAACPARGRREGSRRFGQQGRDALWAEPVRP